MKQPQKLVIAIDGPAASGKSTVAAMLAQKIGAVFLDTGAMYRAVTLAAMQKNIDLHDEAALLEMIEKTDFSFIPLKNQIQVSVDNNDVTGDIRNPNVTENVKHIAAMPAVRDRLVKMQRQFAQKHKRIVTEGRDQQTIAFPDADFKFFITAEPGERARRRQAQLKQTGHEQDIREIRTNIQKRDDSDLQRNTGPLAPAKDAVTIDTTNYSAEQVIEKLLEYINKK